MTPPATISPPATIAQPVTDAMIAALTTALEPIRLEVLNESAQHAGHSGDDGTGETHFAVSVESAAFAGLNRVGRQRLVNRALAELLATRIHALSIRAFAPGEPAPDRAA